MMRRNILLITTDQQRYDALGCNGGSVARTPVLDSLSRVGINFRRAHCQSVVCMPSRATMITGQYPRTHGVFANGVPLPQDAFSVAQWLKERANYRTALLGKAHFAPTIDPGERWLESRMARDNLTGPCRGFDRMELAAHGIGYGHYGQWVRDNYPQDAAGFYRRLNEGNNSKTGAPNVWYNEIPREHYHTDWVAERTLAFLDSLGDRDNWFTWMSFPDPHHPWDLPASETRRVDWRDLELPRGYAVADAAQRILKQKPRHWLAWYTGRFRSFEGAPAYFVPERLTADQLREINAMIHVENELIDEACGRVLRRVAERGWDSNTDIFYTSDHGELQGDFGLLYKGPYHVDGLIRVPLIWRPAPSANVAPAEIHEPVGLIDLAATFCAVTGVPVAPQIQGAPLPTVPGSDRERVLTTWDSPSKQIGMHLRSIYRDGWLCTVYDKSTRDLGYDLVETPLYARLRRRLDDIRYDGSEGELYNLKEGPLQWHNLWNDRAYRNLRADLAADLYDHLPPPRVPNLRVEARY